MLQRRLLLHEAVLVKVVLEIDEAIKTSIVWTHADALLYEWEWKATAGGGKELRAPLWGYPKFCTREALVVRADDFCKDDSLRVRLHLWNVQPQAQVLQHIHPRLCSLQVGRCQSRMLLLLLQEIATGQADTAAARLLSRLGKRLPVPDPEVDTKSFEQASVSTCQPAKRRKLLAGASAAEHQPTTCQRRDEFLRNSFLQCTRWCNHRDGSELAGTDASHAGALPSVVLHQPQGSLKPDLALQAAKASSEVQCQEDHIACCQLLLRHHPTGTSSGA